MTLPRIIVLIRMRYYIRLTMSDWLYGKTVTEQFFMSKVFPMIQTTTRIRRKI